MKPFVVSTQVRLLLCTAPQALSTGRLWEYPYESGFLEALTLNPEIGCAASELVYMIVIIGSAPLVHLNLPQACKLFSNSPDLSPCS